MFPLALGASGCCGCGLGWCTSIFSRPSSSSVPPVVPLGFGGAGGWFGGFGGAGGGLGIGSPSAPEMPLGLEPALPHVAPIIGSTKSVKFAHDKRLPIRGSLLAKGSGKTVFVPHAATNAVSVGDGSAFVVAGSTGLWLHETDSLAKRNRLVAQPIKEVAASPNGSRIAYAFADGRLRIITYPGLTPIVSVKVNVPTRMRFSNDGQRLALGSESDTVTLIDVTPGATPKVVDTEEDVNDVYPMPDKPNEVAYASDEDEVVILDLTTSNRSFASEQHVISWRKAKKPFFLMRDQLAVAFDSVTGTLLGGGDDNMLWRFSNVRTSPKVENPIELSGNVVDIACCAGRTSADRAAFVAVDNAQVQAIGLNGRLGPQFGPLVAHEISQPIRISILPSGDLLVASMSTVFRWEPRAGATLQSKDYAAALPLPSVIDADSVYVLCDVGGCAVHRVAHGAMAEADIETTIVGELPLSQRSTVLRFTTGLRAIVVVRQGTLHVAYLPVGETLEELLDTKVTPGGHFAERNASTHGYVDPSGRVYEIVAIPRGMREIGRALGNGFITALNWDSGKSKWRVDYAESGPVYVP
jgi:hypothetical protein